MVNGMVTSRPDSDVVISSARTVGSESVPVEVEEEGSLELPPNRPLILSANQSAGNSEDDLILFLTFDRFLLDLADSNGIGDRNKTGLGESNGGLNHRLDDTFLGQVGNGFRDTANSGFKDPLGVITGWEIPSAEVRNSNNQHAHEGRLLVQQPYWEIVLPLEGQRLLAPCLGAGREDGRGEDLGRSTFLRFGGIRCLDVIHVDVGDLDILSLELAAEAGTVKAGTEDSSFICIHVDRNLAFPDGSLHGLLNHGCSGGATGENDRRDIFLQKNMSRGTAANGLETYEG